MFLSAPHKKCEVVPPWWWWSWKKINPTIFTPKPRTDTRIKLSDKITYGSKILCMLSTMIERAMRTRKTALKKPESVSNRSYPKVKLLFLFILEIYDAHRPMNNAMQSNNMWKESVISPSELL